MSTDIECTSIIGNLHGRSFFRYIDMVVFLPEVIAYILVCIDYPATQRISLHGFLVRPDFYVIGFRIYSHLVNLASCCKKSADTVNFCHVTGDFTRIGTDRLYPAKFAVCIYSISQRFPSFYNDWHKVIFVQDTCIHTICQCIYKETGRTGFGRRVGSRVQKAGMPITVFVLQSGNTGT